MYKGVLTLSLNSILTKLKMAASSSKNHQSYLKKKNGDIRYLEIKLKNSKNP